jgi:hypothetical protein
MMGWYLDEATTASFQILSNSLATLIIRYDMVSILKASLRTYKKEKVEISNVRMFMHDIVSLK